jgi:hypothetical protein
VSESHYSRFNPSAPNDVYIKRTAQLTSRRCILNIYSTNILTEYFKHAAHSPFFFSLSSKCRLFHNATLFGFCITHILYTECAKIWKKKSVAKRLNMLYNLHSFSSKCRLFHNATLFGFCITHILNTGCAKIWKKKSVAKRLNMLYNLHFFSSKCRLFHNATLFGFCITHNLNTGCAKIWKKNSVAKMLMVDLETTRIFGALYEHLRKSDSNQRHSTLHHTHPGPNSGSWQVHLIVLLVSKCCWVL